MRVLYFTKYTRKGASSRLRSFQYFGFLESAGIQITNLPFFTDEYLEEVYRSKTHNKWQFVRSFIKRSLALLRLKGYDCVVIEKELFPYLPSVGERLLAAFGIRYIVDYDDAIFHNYDQSSNPFIRALLSKKIDVVMNKARAVVVGNEYLRQKAISAGAKQVTIIPTVVDADKYTLKTDFRSTPLTIGWIGSPITAKYLPMLKPVFEKISKEFPIRLLWIGAGKGIGLPDIEEVAQWSETDEVALIKRCEIGIMPLEDNIWERGKCGYKLIQYMACGIPVIGTPLGVNDMIIQNGVNGFKAVTRDDWETAIRFFLANPGKLQTMGLAGRKIMEEQFSLAATREKWRSVLREC